MENSAHRPLTLGQKNTSFVERAAGFAKSRGLTETGSRVLIALSGGPDSCALLLALVRAGEQGLLPRPVGAAHFHHGLRGADADRDAAFSAALCAKLGVSCVVGIGVVPHGEGRSPNDAARRARYAFLEEAARDFGANRIATAHTADDQAETILLRVLRGTSTDGLAGIPPLRDLGNGLTLIRPLLQTRRADVEAFCASENILPRHDPSNEKDKYARARLRKRLGSLADDFNPRLVESLVRLGENARLDADLLRQSADALWQRAFAGEVPNVQLHRLPLLDAHPALRRRVLFRALSQMYGNSPDAEIGLTEAFVSRLEQLLKAGGGACNLPGGFRATADEDHLSIASPSLPGIALHIYELPLTVPGSREILFPVNLRMLAETRATDKELTYARQSSVIAIAFVEGVVPPLVVRSARAGDRIAPLGMNGKTRLVRDVMAEAKWPVARREAAPLVVRADTGEILWLVGLVQAESTRVTPQAVCVVRFSVFPT